MMSEFSYQQQQAYKTCAQYINKCKKGIFPVMNIEILLKKNFYLFILFVLASVFCLLLVFVKHSCLS